MELKNCNHWVGREKLNQTDIKRLDFENFEIWTFGWIKKDSYF